MISSRPLLLSLFFASALIAHPVFAQNSDNPARDMEAAESMAIDNAASGAGEENVVPAEDPGLKAATTEPAVPEMKSPEAENKAESSLPEDKPAETMAEKPMKEDTVSNDSAAQAAGDIKEKAASEAEDGKKAVKETEVEAMKAVPPEAPAESANSKDEKAAADKSGDDMKSDTDDQGDSGEETLDVKNDAIMDGSAKDAAKDAAPKPKRWWGRPY